MTLVIKSKNNKNICVISLFDLRCVEKTDNIRIFCNYTNIPFFIEKDRHVIYRIKSNSTRKGLVHSYSSYLEEITFDEAFETMFSIISNFSHCEGIHVNNN